LISISKRHLKKVPKVMFQKNMKHKMDVISMKKTMTKEFLMCTRKDKLYQKQKKSLNLSPSMKHDNLKQKMTYVKKTQIIFKHEKIGLGKKSAIRLHHKVIS